MKNDDFLNRGQRLRDERNRLGIKTQDELAEILNVKKNSIVRYEKHNAPLDTDQLDQLEDHGFDIPFILWGTRKVEPSGDDLTDLEIEVLESFRNTKSEMQAGLVAMIKTYADQFKL
ncbi:helix-turn-helix domain-containing protein [Acinetobacter seifertii]|uniref:XRE family transcriptional regulator n=1 Tax=Acinetobacter seifertii TaxID=1530123 RepID=A0A7H2V910_9GAMM|nr:helix-turn-helix domain-containing protein [Acinetobacter seifertii]QNX72843.1 XRE family transcriptional regulator [Acinetobacter seifertii]